MIARVVKGLESRAKSQEAENVAVALTATLAKRDIGMTRGIPDLETSLHRRLKPTPNVDVATRTDIAALIVKGIVIVSVARSTGHAIKSTANKVTSIYITFFEIYIHQRCISTRCISGSSSTSWFNDRS